MGEEDGRTDRSADVRVHGLTLTSAHQETSVDPFVATLPLPGSFAFAHEAHLNPWLVMGPRPGNKPSSMFRGNNSGAFVVLRLFCLSWGRAVPCSAAHDHVPTCCSIADSSIHGICV